MLILYFVIGGVLGKIAVTVWLVGRANIAAPSALAGFVCSARAVADRRINAVIIIVEVFLTVIVF